MNKISKNITPNSQIAWEYQEEILIFEVPQMTITFFVIHGDNEYTIIDWVDVVDGEDYYLMYKVELPNLKAFIDGEISYHKLMGLCDIDNCDAVLEKYYGSDYNFNPDFISSIKLKRLEKLLCLIKENNE